MKNIIVFGACSAIAQATQRLWAKEGARLVLIDKNEEKLKIVADDLKTRGASHVHILAADLTDLSKHTSLIKQALSFRNPAAAGYPESKNEMDFGSMPGMTKGVDETIILIAYGTLGDQKANEQDFAVAHQELTTNFISVASLLTVITNYQLQITNYKVTLAVISSVAGDRGRQSNYIYGTAKGALTIFLQGLRNRLAKTNIHVLTIKPGFVDTPMTANFKKGLLWVKPEVIARGIVRAVEKKQDVAYLPWFWRYIMLIIRAIPERIFKKMKL